jgi:type IX secretion system PorP/SprF family membrane protein
LGHRELRTAGITLDTDIRISSATYITMGIMGGYQMVDYNIEDATTAYIESLNDIYNYNAPVVGTGFNLIFDHLHIGISGYYNLHPFETEVDLFDNFTFYSNASYWFRLDDEWRLKLSGLYKSRGNYASIAEGGVFFLFKDIVWVGTSYRYKTAAIVSADIKFSDYIRMGYSYAMGMGGLANFTGSSHEIQLMLSLPQRKENNLAKR